MPTNTFKKAATDLTTSKVMLTLITISHTDPAFGDAVHMVDNPTPITSSITSPNTPYLPYGFSFAPPDTSQGGDPSTRLEVEDVDRILNSKFRSVNSEADITLSVVLSDDPDQIEIGPLTFSIIDVKTSGAVLSLALVRQTVLRNNLTGFNMDINYFPGLFL